MSSETTVEVEDRPGQLAGASTDEADALLRVSIAHLVARYGLVLDGKALAEVLRYPSQSALERSMQRGHLRLSTLKLPNRRGIFVHAHELAQYLVRASSDETAASDASDESADSESGSSRRPQIEKGA